MAPIESAVARSLRTKLTTQNSLTLQRVTRGITATSKNATTLTTTGSKQRTPLIPQGFLPTTVQRPRLLPPRNQQTPFNNLLNAITHSLTITPRPSLPHLHNLLRSYTSNSDHWSQFAHANPEKQYTRNLVCEVPGIFNLLLLVWTPGKKSPVHDHADAHCLMKVLKGEIRESRFAIPQRPGSDGPLVQTSSLGFRLNKVSYMADQLGLHSISNPHPTEYAATLHLYTPPNAAMRGCQVYDTENGEVKHVMQGVYDSVGGKVSQVD